MSSRLVPRLTSLRKEAALLSQVPRVADQIRDHPLQLGLSDSTGLWVANRNANELRDVVLDCEKARQCSRSIKGPCPNVSARSRIDELCSDTDPIDDSAAPSRPDRRASPWRTGICWV
jgi:hypothetical protein